MAFLRPFSSLTPLFQANWPKLAAGLLKATLETPYNAAALQLICKRT